MKLYRFVWPITRMAFVLCVSVSGYYKWLSRTPSKSQVRRNQALLWIGVAHEQTRQSYGVERVQQHLAHQGISLSLYMIRRTRERQGLYCKRHKRYKHRTNKLSSHIDSNLVEQQFATPTPNRVWVSDITYIWTDEGWLYLAGVKDLCTKELVGYSLSSRLLVTLQITLKYFIIT